MASGVHLVAMGGNVFVNPNTITGSIGVITKALACWRDGKIGAYTMSLRQA